VSFLAEHQKILGIDFGEDGAVDQLLRLREARQVAIQQAFEVGTAGH
jgi:hypothetical protein